MVMGVRKPSQESFPLSTQNIRGLKPVGQRFFFKTLLSGQVSFILFAYSTGGKPRNYHEIVLT